MNLKRSMGVALAFLLLLATCINAFHFHEAHIDDHTSISPVELEADCSLCDQFTPNGNDLKLTPKLEVVAVRHSTPFYHCKEQIELRPVATLAIAPKTSPPSILKRT